jgi:hypothetical protein
VSNWSRMLGDLSHAASDIMCNDKEESMSKNQESIYTKYKQWRDNPHRKHFYQKTLEFFEEISGQLTIIGVIIAIISLPPLFFSAIFGETWYQNFISESILGISMLDAMILATTFAVIFIYLLLALILIKWFDKIWLSNINLGEKLFSLVILLIGSISILLMDYFIGIIWYTAGHVPISLLGLNGWLFNICLATIIICCGVIELYSQIQHWLKYIIYLIIIAAIIALVWQIAIPAININNNIVNLAKNYTVLEKSTFSFEAIPRLESNETPSILSIHPNYTNYPSSSINIDYADCHWSTNYGYFFTINSQDFFLTKQSNDFIVPKCIENPNDNISIYWSYDKSDYGKNKSPFLISLQVENSNKKLLNEKSDTPIDYIIGGFHSNFTWINSDTIELTNSSIF